MADITTTFGALAELQPALARLAGERLPAPAAIGVAKLAAAVAGELRLFHEHRNALVEEFGTTTDATPEEQIQTGRTTTTVVLPTSPHWATFLDRARELAAVEVTFTAPRFDPAAVPGLLITAADLLALTPVLVQANGNGKPAGVP